MSPHLGPYPGPDGLMASPVHFGSCLSLQSSFQSVPHSTRNPSLPLPPRDLPYAWAYRGHPPPHIKSPLVNRPCTSQAACTGCLPHCAGCFLLCFLVLSSVPLNTSAKQDLGCKAGSRIISILQVRRWRLREVKSHAQGQQQEVQWLLSHVLSNTPCSVT